MSEYRNVIVFGESGAGKSSVVNMLEGDQQLAAVADHAEGVTFQHHLYIKKIGNSSYNIYDTVGLNEGSKGKVFAEHAINNLYKLLSDISNRGGGVSLLVFVMRAPRIKIMTHKNYQMFYEIFCDKQVPIVLVVTGLENRENMDEWWDENKHIFDRYGMSFNGVACITATKGRRRANGFFVYEDEYQESRTKVDMLISTYANVTKPWRLPAKEKLMDFIVNMINTVLELFNQPMDTGKVREAKKAMQEGTKDS